MTEAVAATNPDAELLGMCAKMRETQATLDALVSPVSDEDIERLDNEIISAMEQIAALPARTEEGMRAKAEAAYTALMSQVVISNAADWQEDATAMETLALSALREMAGTPA